MMRKFRVPVPRSFRRIVLGIAFALAVSAMPAPQAFAAGITWNGSAGDNIFTTAGNWIGGVLPGTADDAYFTNNVVSPTTCEVDAAITVGGVEFLNGFNVANTMTLGNGSGTARTLTLSSGTSLPLVVDWASGGIVTFDKRVNAGSADLTVALSSSGGMNVVNAGATVVFNTAI